MRRLMIGLCLFALLPAAAGAEVNLAVSQQDGATAREAAERIAARIGGGAGEPVEVVVLADNDQIETWLNRYATAELALVKAGYLTSRTGRFLVIGPVDADLVLIGRQGIGGDLPRRAATAVGGGGERPAAVSTAAAAGSGPSAASAAIAPASAPVSAPAPAPVESYSSSKSSSEDRYFVIQVYRDKFGRDPEPERLEYWAQQLQSGALSKRQFADQLCHDGMALCEIVR